jgi:phospholipid transport system substrate-binding protein
VKLVGALAVVLFSLQPTLSQATDEVGLVTQFQATLVDVMLTSGDFSQRKATIAPAVAGLFDVATIARVSAGSGWRELRDDQRSSLVDVLHDLISSTYADRRGPIVKTRLLRKTGEPVNLDYYFRNQRAYDVVVDGVSDLSLRRADYSSVIKNDGFDELIALLNQNIVDMQNDSE